ncbi:hypothetical protein E2I00_013431, partial [Balaenoptera physalus]
EDAGGSIRPSHVAGEPGRGGRTRGWRPRVRDGLAVRASALAGPWLWPWRRSRPGRAQLESCGANQQPGLAFSQEVASRCQPGALQTRQHCLGTCQPAGPSQPGSPHPGPRGTPGVRDGGPGGGTTQAAEPLASIPGAAVKTVALALALPGPCCAVSSGTPRLLPGQHGFRALSLHVCLGPLTLFSVPRPGTRQNMEKAAVPSVTLVVGCGVSSLTLLMLIIIYVSVWRYIRSERSVILINFCLSIISSNALILIGQTQTRNKVVCTLVAAFLHFFFLSSFCWVLTEAWQSYLAVTGRLRNRLVRKRFLCLGWGLPALVVAISVGFTKARGYSTMNYCWLSLEGGLLYAFVGPAAAVVLVNMVIGILVFNKLVSKDGITDKKLKERAGASLWSSCVVLPLLALTWMSAVLAVQDAVKCRVVDRQEEGNGDSGGSFQNGHAQLMVGLGAGTQAAPAWHPHWRPSLPEEEKLKLAHAKAPPNFNSLPANVSKLHLHGSPRCPGGPLPDFPNHSLTLKKDRAPKSSFVGDGDIFRKLDSELSRAQEKALDTSYVILPTAAARVLGRLSWTPLPSPGTGLKVAQKRRKSRYAELDFEATPTHPTAGVATLVQSRKNSAPTLTRLCRVSLPPAPACLVPSSLSAFFSPLPICSALCLYIGALTPSTARRPAARKAADAQQAALGEPPKSARATRVGEERAGAAAAIAARAAERGVGEVGRHHPAGGSGHHRPPDRGLSGRAAATHRATEEGCCSARSRHRTGTDTLTGGGQGPRPGLRALGRRPGRGPQCWDQSQTGQEAAA